MNTAKVTRIPYSHLIYVKEYIRHGDKERAYGKAYPNAQPKSRRPAAWRLSRRPEIQELIEEKQKASIEKGFAAAEAEAVERYTKDFLSLYERRAELARIVRRQARMNKYYKFKDEVKTMDVPVDNPSAILRAIELDKKLEAEYFAKKPATEKAKGADKEEEPYNLLIYIDKKSFRGDEEDLTEEEYDYAIKQSLTNDDFIICPPTLQPKMEELGCTVHRDMETGKYEFHCPADKVKSRQENGETVYYYEREEKDEKQVTSGNINSPQTTDRQHEAQKSSMRHTRKQIPGSKSQIPSSNPDSRLDPIPNSKSQIPNFPSQITDQKSQIRYYFYPSDIGELQSEPWVDIARVLDDYWYYYLRNQNMNNKRMHEAIARLSRSRNQPPEKRREVEIETGWEFHPEHNSLVRRLKH